MSDTEKRSWGAAPGFVAGLVIAALTGGLVLAGGLPVAGAWTAAVAALCAVWWATETLPLPATSLIPIAVFPLLGVLDHKKAASAYGDTLILLFMGGFMLSGALEKAGAHRRLALGMLRLVGGGGYRLVLGFMMAASLISMWISNTATTLMLLPVVLAVIEADEQKRGGRSPLSVPLLLAVGYGATIGGVGSPVGTPPNGIFLSAYEKATGIALGFPDFMRFGVPTMLLMAPLSWLWLARGLRGEPTPSLGEVGPWRPAEKRVLVVFGLTILAWVTRAEPFGGWSGWLGVDGASDSTVALAAAVLLFALPNGEDGRLLDWPTAVRIPWGILLLFGGGNAIALAFDASGLSAALGGAMSGLATLPHVGLFAGMSLAVTFLSEFTSNTALAALLMPVLATAASGANMDPRLLMVPATLAASYAFMMPAGTAPNAIIFGTERITVKRMMAEGLALNLIGDVVITVVCLAVL